MILSKAYKTTFQCRYFLMQQGNTLATCCVIKKLMHCQPYPVKIVWTFILFHQISVQWFRTFSSFPFIPITCLVFWNDTLSVCEFHIMCRLSWVSEGGAWASHEANTMLAGRYCLPNQSINHTTLKNQQRLKSTLGEYTLYYDNKWMWWESGNINGKIERVKKSPQLKLSIWAWAETCRHMSRHKAARPATVTWADPAQNRCRHFYTATKYINIAPSAPCNMLLGTIFLYQVKACQFVNPKHGDNTRCFIYRAYRHPKQWWQPFLSTEQKAYAPTTSLSNSRQRLQYITPVSVH